MRELSYYIVLLPAAALVLSIHELVKARCSTAMGDPTPRKNAEKGIFKYIEPLGLICALIFGYGWGRPTPTSPLYYKDRKKGILITYTTPTLVNLFLGLLTAAVVAALTMFLSGLAVSNEIFALSWVWLIRFLSVFARTNIAVALFNLIPVYPLDGAKILQVFLSPNASIKMAQNEKLLQMMLILLMVLGITDGLIFPVVNMFAPLMW